MKEIFEKNFDKTILSSSVIIMLILMMDFLEVLLSSSVLQGSHLIKFLTFLYQVNYWRKDKNYKVEYLIYCIVILVVLYICYIKFIYMFIYRMLGDDVLTFIISIVANLIISPFIISWLYQYFKQKSYKYVEGTKKEEK